MSIPKPMWAVSSGSYSDYGIHALFTSEELAEEVAAQANNTVSPTYDDYWVESFPVWDHNPGVVTWYWIDCLIAHDGTPAGCGPDGRLTEPEKQPEIRSRTEPIFSRSDLDDQRPVTWEWRHRWSGDPSYGGVLSVKGTDRERVAHVFKDRRAIYMTDPAARLVPLAGDRKSHP